MHDFTVAAVLAKRLRASQALETATFDAIKTMATSVKIGEFQGFPLSVSMDSFSKKITATLSGGAAHRTEFIGSYVHNLKRLENTLHSVDTKIADCQSKLSRLRIEAISHKACASDAQSDFSSDCIKTTQAY